MHITTRSLLAVRTLLTCAAEPGRQFRKHEIAALLDASENHLAQVVHQLGRKGFLATQRGRSGGLRLARPPAEITIGDVLRDFEQCLPLVADCNGPLALTFTSAEDAFYRQLDGVTLASLATRAEPMRLAAE
jgi:Rrf2 family nitric oxide-sensitive transcriptional repressor